VIFDVRHRVTSMQVLALPHPTSATASLLAEANRLKPVD
jgi:hypothetical protein